VKDLTQLGIGTPDGEGQANRGYGCITALLTLISVSCLMGWIVTSGN